MNNALVIFHSHALATQDADSAQTYQSDRQQSSFEPEPIRVTCRYHKAQAQPIARAIRQYRQVAEFYESSQQIPAVTILA
jgi:hypothetical protein